MQIELIKGRNWHKLVKIKIQES